MATSESMRSARDVPLLITSAASSSERRITPSWTIAQLKAKLEQVTGIPPSSQKLVLQAAGQDHVIEAEDEDAIQIGQWPLMDYAEIKVISLNPQSSNIVPSDPSAVPKYTMPTDTYASLPDTVLAYKKSHSIGRFDPHAPEVQQRKLQEAWKEIQEKKIAIGERCQVGGSDTRRGTVAFVGEVPEIPGLGPWVGVALDEPVGKNDGIIQGKKYLDCGSKCGVFVRADRVEVGDFKPLELGDDLASDMEEM